MLRNPLHSNLYLRDPRSGERPARVVALVFIIVFALALVISLGYTFVRQPQYRSSAIILVAPPAAFDDPLANHNSQYVAVQGQVLLSRKVLDALWHRLEIEGLAAEINAVGAAQYLPDYLRVEYIPENMLQLHVEGPDADRLEPLALTWLDTYLKVQSAEIEGEEQHTLAALEKEQVELASHLREKRKQVETFAEQHNITSRVREENDVLTQLSGLSASLATASSEVISAAARLQSLRDSAAAGVMTAEGELGRELARMKSEAARLKGRLSAISQRFTAAYMNKDPSIVALQDQYQLLLASIAEMKQVAHQDAIGAAEKALLQAQQMKTGLQQQLSESEQSIRQFSAHFSRYEELQRELQRLEDMTNLGAERLVAARVGNRNRAPQITVLDQPRTPAEPFYPAYGRDSFISLLGSLLIALLASGVYLLSQRRKIVVWPAADYTLNPEYGSPVRQLSGVQRVDALPAGAQLQPAARLAQPQQQTAPETASSNVRERSVLEVGALLEVADEVTSLLIVLLLGGVRPQELPQLSRQHFNVQSATVNVPGDNARELLLAPEYGAAVLARAGAVRLWLDEDGGELSLNETDTLLYCAAVDAGLSDPRTVTAEALHLTYLAYLVRQGLRLSELARLTGKLPTAMLDQLARFSPEGRGLTLQQIDPVYPALSARSKQ